MFSLCTPIALRLRFCGTVDAAVHRLVLAVDADRTAVFESLSARSALKVVVDLLQRDTACSSAAV